MASAVNIFKTITANLTTSTATVYSTPLGYTTVVLMAQISNISANTIQVTSNHNRSGVPTNIIKGASVPTNDALNILSGKLVLQYGDTMDVSASINDSGQLLLSILETLNS
jgi:hypothetical protein